MQEALVVRRETHIPAPPAAVFALLTDPEKILRWMGTEAQVEPQPGGLYLVNVTGARFARGSFREVVPVHRLAYSFGRDDSEEVPPGSSLIEIDLLEQPHLSKGDQILAIPTLVRKLPQPVRKIIGDLSNTQRVLVGLDLFPAEGLEGSEI